MVIKGIGGALVRSNRSADVEIAFGNGASVTDNCRIVPREAIPLPGTDMLVSMSAIRKLGVSVDDSGLRIAGKEMPEAQAAVMASSVLGSGARSGSCATDSVAYQEIFFNPSRLQASCERYADLLETSGQMLCIPENSVEWKALVSEVVNEIADEPTDEGRQKLLAHALSAAGKFYVDPVANSTIVAQARPCVTAQLSTKLGDAVLDEDLDQRPNQIKDVKSPRLLHTEVLHQLRDRLLVSHIPKPGML